MLFDCIRRILAERSRRRRVKRLHRQQGFVIYCKCGEILNEHPAEQSPSHGLYIYQCRSCGRRTAFDVTTPVPLKVSMS